MGQGEQEGRKEMALGLVCKIILFKTCILKSKKKIQLCKYELFEFSREERVFQCFTVKFSYFNERVYFKAN